MILGAEIANVGAVEELTTAVMVAAISSAPGLLRAWRQAVTLSDERVWSEPVITATRTPREERAETLRVSSGLSVDRTYVPPRPVAAARRVRPVSGRFAAHGVPIVADLAALSSPQVFNHAALLAGIAANALTVLLLASRGLYRPRLHLSILDELPALLARRLAAVGVVVFAVAVIRGHHVPTDTFLRIMALGTVVQLATRAFGNATVRRVRRSRDTGHRTLFLGGGNVAAQLAQSLLGTASYGLDPIGFVDDDPLPGAAERLLPCLGSSKDLRRVVRDYNVAVVIVAFGSVREPELIETMRSRAEGRCEIFVVPRLYEVYGQHGGTDHIGALPVVRLRPPALQSPGLIVKRILDIVLSAVALLLLSPLLLVAAIAVRAEGGKGVIFKQERVGYDGQVFRLWKFRSLKPVDETESATQWNVSNDDRLGRVGKLLRKTSIDELPQLINILRGDMTIVGPRPERPHFVSQFSENDPRYSHRLRMPAGLTGLAQVSGLRGDTSIADRARYDNYYIENWSLWLDLKVILRTVAEVVAAKGG